MVTPVSEGAHWLIRKHVHSGDRPLHPLQCDLASLGKACHWSPCPPALQKNGCSLLLRNFSLGHHVQVCAHTCTCPADPGLHHSEIVVMKGCGASRHHCIAEAAVTSLLEERGSHSVTMSRCVHTHTHTHTHTHAHALVGQRFITQKGPAFSAWQQPLLARRFWGKYRQWAT